MQVIFVLVVYWNNRIRMGGILLNSIANVYQLQSEIILQLIGNTLLLGSAWNDGVIF
jgi:hypothetical protein